MKFLVILCEILILSIAHLAKAQFSDKFHIRHLEPPEGPGYDLFYYDGVSLRDEKWRFDHANHDTAVHRRFGLRNGQSSQFHVVDTLSDANGFRQKTRILSDPASIESLLAMGIEAPTTLNSFQKYEIAPRIQSRDNSQYEGQPQISSRGFLNGVTLGVTLNRPTTPGDSFVQGYVQAGLGGHNNQPGLQFGVPNLGFLDSSRPSNEVPTPNRPLFGLPFFGNNRTPPPPQSPPPPQQQPGIFGLSFGNREPTLPPALPAQTSPPVQSNFFSGLQNLNLPFIGQPQTTTTTEIPATNPSLFANFPSFGFQTTTTAIPETTTTAKGIFGFGFPSIPGIFQNNNGKDANKKINNRFGPPGQSHGHRHPSTHPPNHPSNHPHRAPQPINQNGDGENLSKPVMTEPPVTTTENIESNTFDFSEFFPKPKNITEKLSEELTPPSSTTSIEKLVTEVPKKTGLLQSNVVEPSAYPDIPPPVQNPYVESLVAVVDQNSYGLGVQEITTNSFSSIEPALSSSTKPTDSLRSDDSEPTLSANIPAYPLPNISQTLTEFDATTTENQSTNQIISDINSLSDNPPFPTMPNAVAEPPSVTLPYPLLELAPPFQTDPGVLGIHEDFVVYPINTPESRDTAVPTVPSIIELIRQSQEKQSNEKLLQTEAPKIIESKFLHEDVSQPTQKDDKSAEIIINNLEPDINSLSDNPPFPTMPNAVAEPPSVILPYPLLELAPPFQTDSGVLGIHEDFVVNPINTTELKDTAVPTVTGIIELIRQSQEKLSNEKLLQTEAPKIIESILLHQNVSQSSQKDDKSAEIIINNLEPDINSLSDKPPFPTIPNAVAEPPSVILPYPLLELAPPFQTDPGVLGIHEDFVVNPINTPESRDTAVPTVTGIIELIRQSQEKLSNEKLLQTEAPKIIESILLHQNVSQSSQKDDKSAEIIINNLEPDINSLSDKPPFPTIPNAVAEPPSVILPYPLLELAPPFQTDPGVLGIHEDFVVNPINTPESRDTAVPTVTGIIELIRQSQEKLSNEKLLQTETPKNIESKFLHEDGSQPSQKDDKSAEIIINSLVSDHKAQLSENELLPPVVNVSNMGLNNVIPLETELLPPFESRPVSDIVQSTTTDTITTTYSPKIVITKPITSTAPTTTTPVALTLNTVESPEIDLLPPFVGIPHIHETTMTKPLVTKSTTTLPKISVETNNLILPEIDLLPPFERDTLPDEKATPRTTTISTLVDLSRRTTDTTPFKYSPKIITTTSITTTAPKTTAFIPLILNNVGPPENDVLLPTEGVPPSTTPQVIISTTTFPKILDEINNLIPPEIDLLPPFESVTVPDEEITGTNYIPKNITTITRTTNISTLMVDLTENNFTVPEINLLPPFEVLPVSNVVVKTASSTMKNQPKTKQTMITSQPSVPPTTTSTVESAPTSSPKITTTKTTVIPPTTRTTNVIRLPESDLLPPYDANMIVNSSALTTTDTPKTSTKTMITPRTITSLTSTSEIPHFMMTPEIWHPVADVKITTSTTTTEPKTTPFIIIRLPESDLLPPFEEHLVPDVINNSLSENSTSTPKTTITTTVTPKRTTSTKESTTKIPPKISVLAVPDIDLLPPFKGVPFSGVSVNITASTTTIKPKTTVGISNRVEIVPDIHLLPRFEATIYKTTTAIPRTTTSTVTPNTIRLSESDLLPPETELLPPLKSNSAVERPISFKVVATMPTIMTTTSQRTTTQKILNSQVTTTPRLVSFENVKPIYQRTTLTPPIKYPEVDLLPPYYSENNILPTKQTLSTAAIPNIIMEVKSRFTGNKLSDNPVLPVADLPTLFNILTSTEKPTTTILTNTKSPSTINTKSFTTTSRITSTTIPPTEKLQTDKPVAHIPPPSKFFLPPFKTPSYSLELNTSSTRLTEAFDDSTAVGTTKQLNVNSVREIIENTSQTAIQKTTRNDRSPANKHHKFTELRSPPKHEARRHQNRHKFHSHIRAPETELIPPPKLKPGQLDVFNLETFITQGGYNLNGPVFFGPNINEMRVSPEVIPSTQNPSEFDFVDKMQTTTEGLQIVMVADGELTTKAGVVVKRPIFVNVDDENDMETTTSLLDVKLSPNAIKSLIG